jgi:hypothetical protein
MPPLDLVREIFMISALGRGEPHLPSRPGRPRGWPDQGEIGPAVPLVVPSQWIEAELRLFAGNLVAHEIMPDSGMPMRVVSVYSPAWPLDPARLKGVDVASVKLTLNRDVWVTDLLWASMVHMKLDPREPWVFAGDFNLSETFDLWPGDQGAIVSISIGWRR